MNSFQYYRKLATEKSTVKRALRVALLVGILLNIINHPTLFLSFSFENLNPGQVILTFLVPFCVSTYSSILTNSSLRPGKVSRMDGSLECLSCRQQTSLVRLGQAIEECPNCKEKTHWKRRSVSSVAGSEELLLQQLANKRNEIWVPHFTIKPGTHLPIDTFREMDYLAIEEYHLPIELMMENAGLQLARLVSMVQTAPGNILIGMGTGNNGGGGLVAARRLAGWGYKVFLDIPVQPLNPLPEIQLQRALAFGAEGHIPAKTDVYVDALLGFSQRLPLSEPIQKAVDRANALKCIKISLDLPTGFNKETGESIFRPDSIMTLGAMKSELIQMKGKTEFYIADLGLPKSMYRRFGIEYPESFKTSGLLLCVL